MDADGSNVQQLTSSRGWVGVIHWSLDGNQIFFERDTDPPATGPEFPPRSLGVYVMDSDGSNVQRLTHTPVRRGGSFAPEWSPDGQKIVFDSTRDGNFEIYVMDADGSNVQRLTHNDKVDARPTWSPDGQRIVFHSSRDSSSDQPPYLEPAVFLNFEIYVMDADGGNVERLTSNNHFDGHPELQRGYCYDPKTRSFLCHAGNAPCTVGPCSSLYNLPTQCSSCHKRNPGIAGTEANRCCFSPQPTLA